MQHCCRTSLLSCSWLVLQSFSKSPVALHWFSAPLVHLDTIRASGSFRQLLEARLGCRTSPLLNFRPASEYNLKAAGRRATTTPWHATKRSSSPLPIRPRPGRFEVGQPLELTRQTQVTWNPLELNRAGLLHHFQNWTEALSSQ